MGLPSSDWTIIKLQLRGHLDVPIINASDWSPPAGPPAVDFDAPFIVRGAALDKELKPHQSLINVWISGFDRNETVCSKGRASWPLPKAAVLRNAMLKYAPDGVQELESGNDGYNKILKECQISGMAAVSRNSGSEPYSAGTLRYTLHGSRSFIFAYVHHIVEYLEHEKDPLVREPSTVDLSNALKFLDSEGANALRAHGLQLHKATLREGELMYTPPGMWLLDFSDGATRSFFVQASVIKRAGAESNVAKSLLSLTKANIKSLKVMNDDTEILKVTKFHDAMIRSITGQPGHLYAGEALSGLLAAAAAAAPASAVVRFRGCGCASTNARCARVSLGHCLKRREAVAQGANVLRLAKLEASLLVARMRHRRGPHEMRNVQVGKTGNNKAQVSTFL